MKKHILAVSVAAAFGAAATVAQAAPTVAPGGVGHINILPYFTTQGNKVTQVHIVNTDTVNGKAVKVRFRGAEWSDDVFDFTVYLSPSDVFTGQVSADSNGVSKFTTTDTSCTHPVNVNRSFPTSRISGNLAAGTREGYVEVFNMGDIRKSLSDTDTSGMDLFRAIKHVNGTPPCKSATSGAAFNMFNTNDTTTVKPNVHTAIVGSAIPTNVFPTTDAQTTWWAVPTGTLTTWSRIIDIVDVNAYNATATAVQLTDTTRMNYFTQSVIALTATKNMTTDGIFFGASTTQGLLGADTASSVTPMYYYDMPDLSTPIEVTGSTDGRRANEYVAALTAALQKSEVISEYSTASDVNGATDIVLAQPTRRYYYSYTECVTAASCATEGTDYSRSVGTSTQKKYIVAGLSSDAGNALTVENSPYGLATGSGYITAITKKNRINIANLTTAPSTFSGPILFYNREEGFVTSASSIVISPSEPTVTEVAIKGEVSVLSLNNSGAATSKALGAKLTLNDFTAGGYDRGWLQLSLVSSVTSRSLPIIGFTALSVSGGQYYGSAVPLRWRDTLH